MLRNDAYWFPRLGRLSRARPTTPAAHPRCENYHLLLPDKRTRGRPARLFPVGGDPALGVGAHRLSLGLRDSLQPWLVADLLILKEEMPRSLASCYEAIVRNLDSISGAYGPPGPAQPGPRHAGAPAEQPHGTASSSAACTNTSANSSRKQPDGRRHHRAIPAMSGQRILILRMI